VGKPVSHSPVLNLKPRVSVVIKTYDDREKHRRAPEERQPAPVLVGYLLETLDALRRQTLAPQEVLVVDSSRGDGILRALEAPEASIGVPVRRVPIPSQEFSHPRALNVGVREAAGEIVSILSGDATPANERWLESLVVPLSDPQVAGTYSRQIQRPGVPQSTAERFRLWWRYRRQANFRRRDPLFSNASAAFHRSLAQAMPFDESLMELEDYDWAMKVRDQGYTIVYAGDSEVYHSHSSSSLQTVRRMIYYGYFRAKLHLRRRLLSQRR
jgi:GT2 family glycosyltransferase